MSTPLSDLDARVSLAGLPADARTPGDADLGTSFAVEAGAGSGKTTALVGRVVALAEAGHDVAGLVAITFTRRAAADLRARAYDALDRRARDLADDTSAPGRLPDAPDRLARVRAALGALDGACFDTIHGFCGRLLRSDALAAGVPPDFAVAEEREADEARVDFWRRHVLGQAGSPEAQALGEAGLTPGAVEPLFVSLLRHPDRLPDLSGAAAPDLAPLVDEVRTAVAAWQALRPDPPLKPRDSVQTALDTADRIDAMRGADRPADAALFLASVYDGCGKGKDKADLKLHAWTRSNKQKDKPADQLAAEKLRDEDAPHLASRLRTPLLQWQAHQYDAALAYARDAVSAFEAERLAAGRLTFDDLLHGAARLLRTSPHVRARAAARYPTFLVDEFQDTDPVQAEVLFRLAATDATAGAADWTACQPRPGALCVVGDPKQSVYRFRRADIETYTEVVDLIAAAGGERLVLSSCFRTRPALCDWINGALTGPFADDCAAQDDHKRQATYVNLLSGRPAPSGAPALHVARLDVERVPGHTPDAVAYAEADRIAAFIRAAVDGRVTPELTDPDHDDSDAHALQAAFGRTARYRDVLVVCRASTRFGHYAAAFERAGIPYTLGGDKRLGFADEALALLSLLDAARDPLDGAAVAAHRVGLLGGLSSPDLLVARGHALAPADPDGVHAAAQRNADAVVRRARVSLARLPAGTALEQIATETGLLATASAREGGSERAGGLLRLIARAQSDQADGLHWTEVHDRLRDLVDGVTEDGRITLEEGAPDAVRILNAHQAKGLEAPVVFLADPAAKTSHEPREHTGRDANGRPVVTVPLSAPRGPHHTATVAAPLHWHERDGDPEAGDAAEARRYDAAEARRLAYVAATRARGLLVVSRYRGTEEKKIPKRDGGGTRTEHTKDGEGPWGLFHKHLDGAPDIDRLFHTTPHTPAVEPGGDGAAGPTREQVAAGIPASARRPTVVRHSPSTHGTTADRAYVPASGVSYGSAYGSAVHGLFEWAVRHRDSTPDADRATALALWDDQDADAVTVDAGLAALARFRASALWARLGEADQILCEAPVAGPAAPDADGTPAYAAGTVDLAFRDADGWHLVDYKTDGLDSTDHRARLADHYAPQLRSYASLWKAATGAAPASLSLLFTDASAGGTVTVSHS